MEILAVSEVPLIEQTVTNAKININNRVEHYVNQKFDKQKVYASNICFKGAVPLTALMNDYKWFLNVDKQSPVDAFLKITAPQDAMESLLRCILQNNETKYQFIESITSQPRNMETLFDKLMSKLPANNDFLSIYNSKNPYSNAYREYIDKILLEAKSIEELLKIRPDWKGEVLIKKYQSTSGNSSLIIGSIPEEIGQENYVKIVEYLKKYIQLGAKSETKIDDFKGFKFKNIIDGKTEKNVFEAETPSGKKYIIKIANPTTNSLDGASALGTCCKIDAYLTLNKCRNAAPLKYYNHGDSIAIYDYINHSKVDPPLEMHSKDRRTPDIYKLGLTPNDTVGTNNYFMLDTTQSVMRGTYGFEESVLQHELISVDNDHCTYGKKLSPVLNDYFYYLPNGMGTMFF